MLKMVQKTKREFYQKIASEANVQNIWQIRNWTKQKITSASPPIHTGDDSPPATSHAEKCNVLRKHLFPNSPTLPGEPPIDLTPKPEDIEYVPVTKREARDAIFTAAQLNTPGISGLTGRAWRWAWSILHEEIFNLLRLAADSGHHPMTWRTSIAIAIQKPNRDYSLPRSYRLIQLLEVIGKALERVQARRLAFIAAKYSLIPPTHFGGVPGKSAQDALLTVMNDVETAWHHNKVVTMLTYNITGFFDTIPHTYLINTMCTLHVPLTMVQWTHSFLQNRKASISLDGKQDPLSYINTGVPQGSCTSPILAAYFTAPLGEAIHTGAMTKLNQLTSITNNI